MSQVDALIAEIGPRFGLGPKTEALLQELVLIEYKIEDMGTTEDLEKRHRLEDRMQEVLGCSGLGFCDGGSIGSGTMEVCCFVIDIDIAKKLIQENLKGTEFDDYQKIYHEESEGDDHPIPIESLENIDLITLKNDKSVDLVILSVGYLDDSEYTQNRILDKIKNYVKFINHQDFEKEFGKPSAQKTAIVLKYDVDPHPAIFQLIDSIKDQINSYNSSILIEKQTDIV